MNIVDEDDCTFEKRLKSLMQDNKIKKQLNTKRCNENFHNCDNFYDSYENVHNNDNFYDSSEKY
ncbi:Pv-fam-d protein, partial [Plasmodium cynomolgi strain B]